MQHGELAVPDLAARFAGMTRAEFVWRLGSVYEHSPWVAETVFDGGSHVGCESVDELARQLAAAVESSGEEAQLALLRAHPELVGKVAVASLTLFSQSEQTSAGLGQCTPEEYAAFQRLNASYNATFGFPFIIAVSGLERATILSEFERRSKRSAKEEFRTALDEVHKIAYLRLRKMAVV